MFHSAFTRDNHEEVFLAGRSLWQILHDVPVALNQLLHLIRLSISIILLNICFILIVILAARLFPLPLSVFFLFGSFLRNRAHVGMKFVYKLVDCK